MLRFIISSSAVCLLLGCVSDPPDSSPTTLNAEELAMDSVQFTTSTSIASNPPPNVDVTKTGAAARAILEATLALPAMPDGGFSCPVDWGISYTLDFSSPAGEHITATLDPNGCMTAEVSVAPYQRWQGSGPGDDYWITLANNLGIEVTKIFPYSPPN